jgi:6-phosphogluconolactonase
MSGEYWVYFGTYTDRGSRGIYVGKLNLANAELKDVVLAGEASRPSFVAIQLDGKHLYAVGEMSDFAGKKAGAVSAFAIDPRSGKLTLLNQQSSGGPGPCYVAIDRAGKNVLVANYGGGSVACLPIQSDGSLAAATSFIQHEGSSIHPRQKEPHAHSINLDPNGRFAFVPDLGLDKIMIYRFVAERGELTPHDPAFAVVAPGSGPRHLAFHSDGRHAYVINEIASTVTAFEYDPERGELTPRQTISTLPEDFRGQSTGAEIQVHPSGQFVYASNRGHDSIAAFAVGSKGELTPLGQTSTQGKTPRNFGIDPTGKYLIAANQDSDNVVLFRINQDSGALEPTGQSVPISAPVCVRFMAPPVASGQASRKPAG